MIEMFLEFVASLDLSESEFRLTGRERNIKIEVESRSLLLNFFFAVVQILFIEFDHFKTLWS